MLSAGDSLQEILDGVTVAMEEVMTSDARCTILLLDPDGRRLRSGSAPSMPAEYSAALDGLEIGPEEGSCGSAAALNQVVIVHDIATDPKWAAYKHLALPIGLRACWSVPIRNQNGTVAGTFALYHDAPTSPNDSDLRLIEAAADLVGLAIERVRMEERLMHAANHDPLTGLPNRRHFLERLQQRIERAKTSNDPFAVFYIDLDGFKHVNDTLGHAAGDQVIVEAAHRLAEQLSAADTVSRFGGDEFTVLLDRVATRDDIERAARNILDLLEKGLNTDLHTIHPSASIGVALGHGDATPEQLLQEADHALYQAKASGGAGWVIFQNDGTLPASSLVQTTIEMRDAITRNQFVIAYQPIVSLESETVAGAEALLRWQHPTRGLLQPKDFVQSAEGNHLIIDMDRWVLRQALDFQRAVLRSGRVPVPVSVNLSARHFLSQACAHEIENILDGSGIDARLIAFEITESTLITSPDIATATLLRLRSRGAGIYLDDFGTGYASLLYLSRFPITHIKLPLSLVGDIAAPGMGAIMTRSVTAMAHEIGVGIIVEGVETAAEVAALVSVRCDAAQGFYFYPPLPADEALRIVCLPERHAAGTI